MLISKANVKLLTFNAFLRPPPIKTNDDDFKQERFEQILEKIKEYDIVCLQEMFQTGSFRVERIIEQGLAYGFNYWKKVDKPSFLPGPVVDSGLLVLSKFPILSSHSQSYGIGVLSDSASDKGYIYCKLKIKTSILHLFVTHLQASYMEPGKDLEKQLSVKARMHQAKILQERIDSHLVANQYTHNDLVMLIGDLNINHLETPFCLSSNSHLFEDQKRSLLKNQNGDKFNEYEAFETIFIKENYHLIDHVLQKYHCHPPTFGVDDVVMTDSTQVGSKQSLDYIFTVRPPIYVQGKNKIRAKSETCVIEEFRVQGKPYGQLSDHYGISIQIETL